MTGSVLIPITNVYAKGDYSAEIQIGSEQQTANLILDTGSSTMVVQQEDYDPSRDKSLQATEYAQDIIYGIGGWYGPVVKTQVTMGSGLFQASLADAYIAVTRKEQANSFGLADGILGLAYHELNRAYNLHSYLQDKQINPALTYPWYLASEQADDSVRDFRQFLHQFPHQNIAPYFTQLEEQGVVGNQFAFIIHRSSIYQTDSKKSTAELKQHPLNNGLFILGNPLRHTQLYRGELKRLKVLHDKYYNVNLLSLQVGNCPPIAAPALAEKDKKGYVTNAIIDSGASGIILPKGLFEQLFTQLIQLNPDFASILDTFRTFEGTEKGIALERVKLDQWPDLRFVFEGFDGELVTLTMTPDTYWQSHAPEPMQISLQFITLAKWPNQSVLGLPLMNNYFTLFDRQDRTYGSVIFAEKSFAPHRLSDAIHSDVQTLKTIIAQHNQTEE